MPQPSHFPLIVPGMSGRTLRILNCVIELRGSVSPGEPGLTSELMHGVGAGRKEDPLAPTSPWAVLLV